MVFGSCGRWAGGGGESVDAGCRPVTVPDRPDGDIVVVAGIFVDDRRNRRGRGGGPETGIRGQGGDGEEVEAARNWQRSSRLPLRCCRRNARNGYMRV